MLNVQNVSYSYTTGKRRVDVLKDVSFSFAPATLYAIQGPSGSGKSTLLSLLAGLDAPKEGKILLDDMPIENIPPDEYRSRKVAMIFQKHNLLPFMTVEENAAYPAVLQQKPREEANKEAVTYLKSVAIDEKLFKRMPHDLSGGEQQRVAIARALCSKAEIILADEPTGSLDSENGHNILSILSELAHHDGRCVILVTHDGEMAAKADVILAMKDGQINA